MNSTIVLNRLTAARAEGGNAHAITAAQALVTQYYPGRTFDAETAVNAVFNALDRFDAAGAEAAIDTALAALTTPVVAADTDVAADVTDVQDASHEGRLIALENAARRAGVTLAVPAGVGTHEQRLTVLEDAARSRGLL